MMAHWMGAASRTHTGAHDCEPVGHFDFIDISPGRVDFSQIFRHVVGPRSQIATLTKVQGQYQKCLPWAFSDTTTGRQDGAAKLLQPAREVDNQGKLAQAVRVLGTAKLSRAVRELDGRARIHAEPVANCDRLPPFPVPRPRRAFGRWGGDGRKGVGNGG